MHERSEARHAPRTLVLPDEDADAFQARLNAWNTDLKPADDVERFLVTRAVQLSWQLERADRALAARAADARTAADGSVERLVEDVIAMGRRLFWDPRGTQSSTPSSRSPSATPPRSPGRARSTTPTTRPG